MTAADPPISVGSTSLRPRGHVESTKIGGGPGRVRSFLRLVVIEHSVFALPFAYVAALTAMRAGRRPVDWATSPW